MAYPVVAGVLLHGFVKWPASLHIEVGSHLPKRKLLRKLKVAVGIRAEHQNVVNVGVVGFPPCRKMEGGAAPRHVDECAACGGRLEDVELDDLVGL